MSSLVVHRLSKLDLTRKPVLILDAVTVTSQKPVISKAVHIHVFQRLHRKSKRSVLHAMRDMDCTLRGSGRGALWVGSLLPSNMQCIAAGGRSVGVCVCEGMFVFRKINSSVPQENCFEVYNIFFSRSLNPLNVISVSYSSNIAWEVSVLFSL